MSAFQTTVLVRSEESEGRVGIVENVVPAGWEGPPLHHHAFDEAFYVLEGELTFRLGDEIGTAGPGALVFAPGGAHHTLANRSGAAARYLLVCTPGGFERYFDRIAAEQAGVEPPASASLPNPETTVVGPSIGGAAAAGPLASPGTGGVNVLLRGEQNEGRVALMDNAVSAGMKGPPLHHHAFDEAFYVLEGELTFRLGDDLVTRSPGELAFAPGGAHHTFANRSGAGARVLIVCTPAGFERYFDVIAARQAGVDPPPETAQGWPEVVKVGPQIGDRE